MARKKKQPSPGTEYSPVPNGPVWSVEQFDELAKEFALTVDQLPQFHEAASKFGNAWTIVRQLYGINPLIVPVDSDATYLKPLSIEKIGAELGLDRDGVKAELSVIHAAWRRKREDPDTPIALPPPPTAPEPAPPSVQSQSEAGGLPPQEKARLLHRYGLSEDVLGSADTEWAVAKILDYQKLLDEPAVSALVHQAIINELLINRCNREMLSISAASEKFALLQETKKTLETNYQAAWKQINAIFPWADQVSNRVNMAGVFSDIIRGIQDYQSKKDNARINGLHTSFGLQIRLRESLQQPIRMRIGQTAAMLEAMSPDALWDPNWRRTLTDYHCKLLDEGFREGARRVREAAGVQLPDLESDHPTAGEYPPLFVPPPDAPEPEPEEPKVNVQVAP